MYLKLTQHCKSTIFQQNLKKKKQTDISKSQTYCWKAYIKSNIRKHSLHRITDPDENTEIQGEGNIMGLCTFLCTFKIAIIF